MNSAQFSRNLGWFSIALGAAELLAPRRLARSIGVGEQHQDVIRMLGARELASGVGILTRPKPTGFMWSRVAGDIMDLSLLGAALAGHDSRPAAFRQFRDADRQRLIGAIVAVAGVTVVDLLTSLAMTRRPRIEPSWRYTPAGGRAGIAVPARDQLPVAERSTNMPDYAPSDVTQN